MTQFLLKLIAMLAMLTDHAVKTVIKTGTLSAWVGMETERMIRIAMLVIGRMAFPIFAWFAAEGCRKTSDPKRHLIRLLVFSVLSEVPFQLCFHGTLKPGATNVIFTMLLSALAIHSAPLLERYLPKTAARILPSVLAVALGWVLQTDYNAWGVALVIGLYYLPDRKRRILYLFTWVTVFQLIWHGWSKGTCLWLTPGGQLLLPLYYLGCLAAVALLCCYNGERGPNAKWLFYVFYPAHLLVLYLVQLYL